MWYTTGEQHFDNSDKIEKISSEQNLFHIYFMFLLIIPALEYFHTILQLHLTPKQIYLIVEYLFDLFWNFTWVSFELNNKHCFCFDVGQYQ